MILAVLSQIKFIATYLVPSLYPSLMLLISFFMAGLTNLAKMAVLPLPGSEWPFVLNCLFWLGCLSLVLTIWLTIKKIFGRQPSLNEVLSGLVSNNTFKDYKDEQHLRNRGLEEQISAARHAFDERCNTDMVETDEQFKTIFRLIGDRDKANEEFLRTISRLQERTETHMREFDTIRGQIERMLRDLPHTGRRDI